jgi:tetratricopeptide (TPR) repeat protein
VLSDIEKTRPLTPREWILRSRAIQLSSGTEIPPLEEAERALQQALEDDDEYIPAILDLAWYYYAVEDDAAKALSLFERAYELSRQNLIEAISGKMEALEELESAREAVAFFKKAIRETVRLEDLDEEKLSWIQDDPELPSPER